MAYILFGIARGETLLSMQTPIAARDIWQEINAVLLAAEAEGYHHLRVEEWVGDTDGNPWGFPDVTGRIERTETEERYEQERLAAIEAKGVAGELAWWKDAAALGWIVVVALLISAGVFFGVLT